MFIIRKYQIKYKSLTELSLAQLIRISSSNLNFIISMNVPCIAVVPKYCKDLRQEL